MCEQILVNRKLAIRDEPDIWLRCSAHVKISLVLPMKNILRVSTQHVTVCTFRTSPCVPAPRAHVLKHVCAWCPHSRRRFERAHGDVLSGHTGFSSVSHTTHRTHTPQHKTKHNTTTRPQHHTETDRERMRERDREDRERRQRQRQREKR